MGIHGSRLLVALLLIATWMGPTPSVRSQELGWLNINGLPQTSVGLEVEGTRENNRVGDANSTYDHSSITPLVGLRTSGSIYHPNLLTFDLDGELGWGWNRSTSTSSGTHQTQKSSQEVSRYLAQVNLLQTKPYNAAFFAAEDHTYQDNGSFETFTVDSTRYGGRVNKDTGTLTLNTDFGYRNERNSGFTGTSEISETYFNFVGIQSRQSGQTTLNYRINQYENFVNSGNNSSNNPSGSTVDSLNQSVGASDSETFGHRKQITATTGASYSQADFSGQQLDAVNANENISINHSPTLDSYFMVNFSNYELRPTTANNLVGSYTVHHQLYESLTSSPDVHGSYQENSSPSGSFTTTRFGLGLALNYNKRLQSWGYLTVGTAIIADHQDDSSSGSTAPIINELHILFLPTSPNFSPVNLDNPNVIASTIQVRASPSGILLVEGTDYQVIPSGDLTQIQLIVPASSTVSALLANPNSGLPVLVNYESDSLNNASYEILSSNLSIRLDLFDKYGIYGRWNWSGNNAPAGTTVQTLNNLVGGADYHWQWFRAGAEFEEYNSNFTDYQAVRGYQSCNFILDSRSTLSLNFNQSFFRYSDANTQTQFLFLSRYNIQFTSAFSGYVEGGGSSLDVLGSETLQGTVRTGVSWARGKLSVRTGYEYNNQYTSTGSWSQELVRNRLFLYMKRTF